MAEMRTLDSLPADLQHFIKTPELGTRTVCPVCQGGSTGELSLSIREVDEGQLLTKLSCWRATCGWWCFVGTAGMKIDRKQLKEGRPYTDPLVPMTVVMEDMLGNEYGLRREVYKGHGWLRAQRSPTLVMPIRDQFGRTRGHITRTFDTPKRCLTFKATSQPWLDWWLAGSEAPVVIVEDTLSACRLQGCGLNAVALLGTSMTTEQAAEIAEVADFRPVHLALDRDAFAKAISMKARHGHILGLDGLYCLTMDVKNMPTDDEIRELFDGRHATDSSDLREEGAL